MNIEKQIDRNLAEARRKFGDMVDDLMIDAIKKRAAAGEADEHDWYILKTITRRRELNE